MSIASDQRLKELEARVAQDEKMIAALKLKLDALEGLIVPRTTRRKEKEWAQQITP